MTQSNKKPDMNKIADILEAADAADGKTPVGPRILETVHPTVLPELEMLLDPLTKEQYQELEKAVLDEGIREPIIIWKEQNAVVDGHNRLTLALKHNLPYKKVEKSFPDLQAVKLWMIRNQLGRRNLTKDRMTYFIGVLYNTTKQDPKAERTAMEDGKTTAQVIGEQHGVSEKTVRRAGEVAKGLDRLEEIRGKLAKAQVLDGKSKLTQEDLTVIGNIKDDKIAEKVVTKLEKLKEEPKEKRSSSPRNTQTVPKPNGLTFPVVLMKPDFESLQDKNVRPPLAKEALVYMIVPDEYLGRAIELATEWDLSYEATFVFNVKPYDGVFSKIGHTFMVIFSKGHLPGPKAGKEKASVLQVAGDPEPMMVKIIEAYHGDQKKLDMRPGAKAAKDWAVVEK